MIKTRLIKLLSKGKKYIAFQVIWQWLALLAQVIAIYSIGIYLNEVISDNVTMDLTVKVGLIIFGTIIFKIICNKSASYCSYKASADVKKALREKIYEKLLKLGTSYRDKVSTSQVVQISGEGVEQLEIYFGRYLPQLFYSLLAPITLFIILFPISSLSSIVLLICVPLIPLSIVAVQKFAKKLLSKYWGVYTGLGDTFLENLQGLTTLKIYKADELYAREMDANAEKFRKITMKVLMMQLNSISVMDIIAYGGASVGIITALVQLSQGKITLTAAVMVILLASEFFIPLRLLGSFFHIAMNGMAASDKIFAFLDLEEPKAGTKELSGTSHNINMENVSFSYTEDKEILHNVSIDIKEKSFVSLVGESGCGKSTISSLISGKHRGYIGEIKIDGIELKDLTERTILDNLTTVTHNSYIFKGTVRENLLMANPLETESEMIKALKEVKLWEFLEGEKGLDTELLEKGDNLSGGQKQRLALARALIHDTPIYIFDEATSNIDAESEDMIMKAILKMKKTKTIILISHRLQNVIESDCIYMIEGGAVVERGTHKALLAKNGKYAKLYNSQKELEAYGREVNINE